MVPEEYRSPQYSSRSSSSHSGKGAGEEHRNGGDPLATPEVPLGPNTNRHPRGTSVVGHYASHRTSSGRPVSEEWVKRQAELWMENPENCTAPLHLSDDPKEIKEWERLVSDICKKAKEKMKTKASENGLDPLTHSPPISTMGVSVGETLTTSNVASNKEFEGFRFTGEPEPPQREWVLDDLIPDDYPSTWYGREAS